MRGATTGALLVAMSLAAAGAGCASTDTSASGETDQGSAESAVKSANAHTTKHHAKTFAKGSAAGDYAIAQASGSRDNPGTVRVRVVSSPSQSVEVSWELVCTRGTAVGSKSGQFKATTPINRALKKPMSKVDNCTGSANAQLSGSGRLTLRLVG